MHSRIWKLIITIVFNPLWPTMCYFSGFVTFWVTKYHTPSCSFFGVILKRLKKILCRLTVFFHNWCVPFLVRVWLRIFQFTLDMYSIWCVKGIDTNQYCYRQSFPRRVSLLEVDIYLHLVRMKTLERWLCLDWPLNEWRQGVKMPLYRSRDTISAKPL